MRFTILIIFNCMIQWHSLVAQTVKKLPEMKETWFILWVRKILWRSKWLPAPVILPGEFHGERSLVGYSMWGCKESEITKLVNNTSVALNTLKMPNLSPPSISRTFLSSQTETLYPLNTDFSFPPTPTGSCHSVFRLWILFANSVFKLFLCKSQIS